MTFNCSIRKKIVIAYVKVLSRSSLRENKNREEQVKIAGVISRTQTMCLQIESQACYYDDDDNDGKNVPSDNRPVQLYIQRF